MYSALFEPDSYEPSHMRLVMKLSLTPIAAATPMQQGYRLGVNVTPCNARHSGRTCFDYMWRSFFLDVLKMGLQVYVPVHLTAHLLQLRRRSIRQMAISTHLRSVFTRLLRSLLYYVIYIYLGWSSTCITNSIGNRSLAWRKWQYLICGSLPSLSILFESPGRRRSIGVLICTYSMVSMGTVLSRNRYFKWLQQGSGPIRSVIDVTAFALAVTYTIRPILHNNNILKRLLTGNPFKE